MTVAIAADFIAARLRSGGKVLVAGNGGSAAEAQHFAAELVCRYRRDRRPLPAIALTTDTSVLTAIANDYGYEHVFSRQIEALASERDVVVLLTTSGRSPNIRAAFGAAQRIGAGVVVVTSRSGAAWFAANANDPALLITVDSDDTAVVQERTLSALHTIAGMVEDACG
jgi:D-sedoheptulose 7-phosphate isomerase